MLALWIILAVLAVLALVCSLSVVLYVDIGESTRIRIGIAGLRFTLVDTREESPRQKVKALKKEQKQKEKQARKEAEEKRKREKKRAKAKKKQAESRAKQAKAAAQTAQTGASASSAPKSAPSASHKQPDASQKEDGFTATVKKVVELIRRCFPNAKYLLRHLRFRRVTIAINVGAEDAHTTAVRYGQVQAGVHTTLGLLAGYGADLKLDAVCIQPDFVTGEFRQWITFRIKLRVGVIIVGGLGTLGKIIGYFLAENRPESSSHPTAPPVRQTKKSSAGQAVNQENAR